MGVCVVWICVSVVWVCVCSVVKCVYAVYGGLGLKLPPHSNSHKKFITGILRNDVLL